MSKSRKKCKPKKGMNKMNKPAKASPRLIIEEEEDTVVVNTQEATENLVDDIIEEATIEKQKTLNGLLEEADKHNKQLDDVNNSLRSILQKLSGQSTLKSDTSEKKDTSVGLVNKLHTRLSYSEEVVLDIRTLIANIQSVI